MADPRMLDAKRFNARALAYFSQVVPHEDPDVRANLSKKNVPSLLVLRGKHSNTDFTTRTNSFHYWLLGVEFPETAIFMVHPNRIVFLCSSKKMEILEKLREPCSNLELKIVNREKVDIKKIYEWVPERVIGHIEEDDQHLNGDFALEFKRKLNDYSFMDCSEFLGLLMGMKDPDEITFLKYSAKIACSELENHFIKDQIEDIIEKNMKVSHRQISENVSSAWDNSPERKKMIEKYGLKDDAMELLFVTVQSSSSGYCLKVDTPTSTQPMKTNGTVVCSIGVKYEDYTTVLTRTLLINPIPEMETAYRVLTGLLDRVLKKLTPGITFGELYDFAKGSIPENLRNRFLSNIGFITGIREIDELSEIKTKSKYKILLNSTYSISLGFEATAEKNWAIWIADSVLVDDKGAHLITTADKSFNGITYDFDASDQEPPVPQKEQVKENRPQGHRDRQPPPKKPELPERPRNLREMAPRPGVGRLHARRAQNQQFEEQAKRAAAMEEKQKQWREDLLKDLKERFANGFTVTQTSQAKNSKFNFKGLRSVDEIPNHSLEQITVDAKKDVIVIPIQGQHVPFHISTIKNITPAPRGNQPFYRINFNIPSSVGGCDEYADDLNKFAFLKEITIKSNSQNSNMINIIRMVKESQINFKSREFNAQNAHASPTEPLRLMGNQRPSLRDIHMRPQIGPRIKAAGRLDCHCNGFRFLSARGEAFELPFSNIKHALFQQSDKKNANSIMHFELKEPVNHAKKPWYQIQFLTEVVGAEDLMDKRGMAYGGYDAMEDREDEIQERKLQTMNAAFKHFCKQVEDVASKSDHPFSFDIPLLSLGFHGNPLRSLVPCFPTRDCVVAMQEWPAFCMSISEMEFVVFERYSQQLSEFDLLFINKNYEKMPTKISAIRRTDIDKIKTWLTEINMVWYHSNVPLIWSKVMKDVIQQIQHRRFVEDGGWESWFDEAKRESEEEPESEGSVYNSQDGSDSDVYAPSGSDEESDFGGDSDDDSESGLDWDELEERAEKEDRNYGRTNANRPRGSTGSAPISKRRRRN